MQNRRIWGSSLLIRIQWHIYQVKHGSTVQCRPTKTPPILIQLKANRGWIHRSAVTKLEMRSSCSGMTRSDMSNQFSSGDTECGDCPALPLMLGRACFLRIVKKMTSCCQHLVRFGRWLGEVVTSSQHYIVYVQFG